MDKENIKKGAFLKKLREDSLYTERDLAELIGVEPGDITVWETGIKFPDDNPTLEKLSRILNVSKKELINGEYSKKNKEIESFTEYETVERDYKVNKQSTEKIDIKKTVLLVVLSCVALFTLIVAIAALTKPSTKVANDEDYIYVSDKRETVVHNPRTSNEHIVYNTQALSANKEREDRELYRFGFEKVEEGYFVKRTDKYLLVFKDDTFYLTLFNFKNNGSNYEVEENIYSRLIKYRNSTRTVSVEVEMYPPHGTVDCDSYVCSTKNDYFKYLNLLIDYIRG